jgi:hypothetical protein
VMVFFSAIASASSGWPSLGSFKISRTSSMMRFFPTRIFRNSGKACSIGLPLCFTHQFWLCLGGGSVKLSSSLPCWKAP